MGIEGLQEKVINPIEQVRRISKLEGQSRRLHIIMQIASHPESIEKIEKEIARKDAKEIADIKGFLDKAVESLTIARENLLRVTDKFALGIPDGIEVAGVYGEKKG